MDVILEAFGGKSGLKPNNVMTRDFGMMANMDKAAGGGPSAARSKEWWGSHQKGAAARSKSHIKKTFRLKEEKVSTKKARSIGDRLKINWDKVNLDQLRMGISVESEHDTDDPKTDVVKGRDPFLQYAKIALAHLREKPDYYTRLKKVEEE